MTTTRRDLIAGAGLTAMAAGLGATLRASTARAQSSPAAPGAAKPAAPAPLVPRDFYLAPTTADFALSPSGKRVAVLRNRYTDAGVTSWIDIIDAENPAQPPKTVPLGVHEANSVVWANEKRLLIWVIYNVTHQGYGTEEILRVVGVNDDGTNPAVMFGNRGTSLEYIHNLGVMVDPLVDDEDHVMMSANDPQRGLMGLYKVDVNNGEAVVIEYGSPRTSSWLTQNGQPMIRFDDDRNGTRIMARAPGESDWKFMHLFRRDQIPEFSIFGPSEKAGVFLASARVGDEDKITVREVDLTTLKLGAPLYTPAKVDADQVWLDSRSKLVATSWTEDRRAYDFADKAFAPHFSAMEKYFGPELTIGMREVDDARTRYLGVAHGPREAGIYFMYDRKTHAITELGPTHAHLTADRLGAVHTMSVKTRDGAEIRAYLTQPASGKPGPLVVMPHGGPELRDDWGFEPWAQMLAAEGWWVLQPNYRGSGGYGLAFAREGWKRWGERMQEDVEDATAQALAEFKLDASRVAIFGGSYGGYAALMGAVRKPDLYKAVVSMDGVSDLIEQLKWERKNDEAVGKPYYEFWRQRIGDPEADAAMLTKASPHLRAAEVKAPVFLMHGFLDDIVPVDQSKMMVKALQAAGKTVEYWEIPKEGHSASTRRNERDRMERVIAFLKPHLA